MYSGSDSTESTNHAQWALNPSAYQNMSSEQVDWAALAQQWIIMKEAGPPPMIPADQKPKPKKEQLNEGGEAPMDVENDKEESAAEWNNVPNEWSYNAQNPSWGWTNAWTAPTGVPPPVTMKPPLLPTPPNYNQYNAPPDSSSDNANFAGYSTTPNSEYSSGYWTAAGSSKQMKPHNRRFSKVNVPRPTQPLIQEAQTLDATKRKQLPAWIREGLEKMERDKLKQLEREKEKQERDEYNEKLKQNEKETMEILKTTMREQQKSKFESDGDNSEDDAPDRKRQVRLPEPVSLTPAEQMMNVRRTMTEILLKVTNREIESICREELQRYHKKHKASDHRVSAPSGANVTAKLGLGIYGGSGSSGSDESEEENGDNQKDSDTELKDSIKRKKAEFSKTEREIEDRLAEAESRKQDAVSRSASPDTNDNETQVDAKIQGTRRPPKTSVKRARSRSSSASSDAASSYTGSRKRSSSSSGGRDSKKTSKRGRSRSTTRSRTPEKRRKSSKSRSKRSRSRSSSKQRKETSKGVKYSRRSISRSRRSRSPSYRRSWRRSPSRNRRSRSPYSKSRRSRTRSRSSSRSRKRRSRSSSSGRGKRSRRR